MRLTADLIERSPVFVNTLLDRELDLRGHNIEYIENLGCTQDEFTTMDMSDNAFVSLGNFPLLNRLKTLFVNNCNIAAAEAGLGASLPQLQVLMLHNNNFTDFTQLVALGELKNLQRLALVGNDVTNLPNYRHVMIHLVPSLEILDYQHVKSKERYLSKKFFEEEGANLAKVLEAGVSSSSSSSSAAAAAAAAANAASTSGGVKRKAPQEVSADVVQLRERILSAVKRAKTIDDVTKLSQILQSNPTSLTATLETLLSRIEGAE